MPNTYSRKLRRPMAYLSPYITNKLFLRNPWIALWWSAAFPGCGHLMLCKYFTGFMLVAWEFFINLEAHINQAIFYTMTGNFNKAADVLDTRWFLLYMGVYCFAMWDCFSLAIDLNKFYLLSDREDASIMPFNIGALEINFLDNRMAGNGTIWSFITPGLGYLYINRLPSGFLLLIWFIVVTYYSRLLPAIQATCLGEFRTATDLLSPQWFLFLPSLLGFGMHDVYLQTIASNKFFKMEQSRFFADQYQEPAFRLPFGSQSS